MPQEGAILSDLIRQTLTEPREAARRIIELDLPAPVLWQALALVVLLSVIAAQATTMLSPGPVSPAGQEMMPAFFNSPLAMGGIQGGILVLMVFAVHAIGRFFGGTGAFEDAIALVAWLQFLLVCLQVVQGLLGLVLPGLGGLIGLAGVVVFFWLLTQFVMVLHGFDSAGLVFVGIVVSMLAVSFALSVVLTLMGLTFTGESMSNV